MRSVRSEVLAHAGSFDGVKVFSATMHAQRDRLGEAVTEWLEAHPRVDIVDIVVTQSSDAEFHCITISVFYFQPSSPRRP